MNEKSRFLIIVALMIGISMVLPAFYSLTLNEADNPEIKADEDPIINVDTNTPERRGTRLGSPRTVLAELFTNWGCPPCIYANPPINELMDVYDSSQLVMIAYHTYGPATNDPFYWHNPTPVTTRGTYYDVATVPSMFFNGKPNVAHNGASTYDYYKGFIDTELAVLSPIEITLDGYITATSGQVDIRFDVTDTLPTGDLKIRYAIVEDNNYAAGGSNGEVRHRYVIRDMLPDSDFPALGVGQNFTQTRTFTPDAVWNLNNIEIIVFVQDDNDPGLEVVQAAKFDFIPQKILVVDDDQSTPPHGYEDDYLELLTQMGYAFDGWMYDDKGSLTADDLKNYEAVIWLTGNTASNTLTTADQNAISTYFDERRGGLFLNGENVGSDIGGESFYWTYLHAFYNSDTSDGNITGILSDSISDPYFSVDLEIAGSSPSVINPMTNASAVFYYSPSNEIAAIKAGHDLDSRVVYFPFLYFEGPDSDSNKMDIMERVLNWMVVKVDYIQIRDSPGDSGNVKTDLTLNVGESKTLWAAAYNHTYGFLKNYPITTWNEDSAGSLVTISSPGASTLITAGMAGGSATLTVNYFGVTNTTTITVNPPEPDYITLTDSPDGAEISDFSMLASENILIYASSYNLTSGYLGLVDVDWSDSAGLGTFDNSTGSSTTFTAGIVGGLSTISGDYIAYGIGDSVDITIINAEIDYIRIEDAAGGLGSEVLSIFLDVGESKTLWCAAYNDSAGYLGDHDSTIWSEDSTGSLITISGSGESITVSALLDGGSTTLRADVNDVLTSAGVTVLEPTIDYIQINYQFGVSGTPVIDPIYPVGEEMNYFGAAYNLTSNYLYTVSSSSTWTSSNPTLVSVTSPGSGSTITISDTMNGTSTLTLSDGLGHSYQTTVTVLEPTVDFIRIRSEANGVGDIIYSPTYDVGYEVMYYSACYNNTASYLGDLSVSWQSSEENVGNITPSGGSAQFKAIGIGTYDITLEISSVQLIMTITVNDETDPTADAGSGGNINEDTSFSFAGSGSSDNGVIIDYHWDFGDGNSENGTDSDIDYTFTHPGIYTVTLTVTDAGGNTDSDQISVTVWDVSAPTAQAAIPDNADGDIPCFFDASASSDNVGIVKYKWEFGDGNSYEGEYKNVSHTYQMPGTYTVKLTVKDAAGYEDFITLDITVLDTTAPSIPKGIVVTPQVDGTSLKITWDAVSDPDLKHYELYVSENDGAFTKLQTISIGSTTYTHSGLLMESSYSYYLVSVDTSDNPSADSAIVKGYPDIDTDSDGIFDRQDEDDDGDGLSDFREVEEATDPKNPDSDGDKHEDGEDAFPLDKKEWKDSDFDGVGDSQDAFPKDASEWKDSDGDGVGDKKDFLPIHNLLFLIIMAVLVIAVLVGAMMMVKRKKAKSVSFDGEETESPKTESTPSEPKLEKPSSEDSKELPPPPKKDLPLPPKRMQK